MDAVGGIDFEVLVTVLFNQFVDLRGAHIDPGFSYNFRHIGSHSQVARLIVTGSVATCVDACELIEYVFIIRLRISFVSLEHFMFAVSMYWKLPSGECAVGHSHQSRKHSARHEPVLERLTHVSDLI